MNTKEKSPTDTWMGWSVGRWEGDTLVIEVTDQNDQTWFDRAGDFHSEELKVVERYTALDRNTIIIYLSDNGWFLPNSKHTFT